MYNFTGKIALVTGGGSGIGKTVALQIAEMGAAVVVADIHQESGLETAHAIELKGGTSAFIKTDVRQAKQVAALVEEVLKRFGKLDYCINNVGVEGAISSLHEYPEDVWDNVIETNLKSAWLCMRSVIPIMLQQAKGSIVNISSVVGLVGATIGLSAYSSSKHGIIGLTKSAALEYAQQGIRVNAVCPGVIQTPLFEKAITQHPQYQAQLELAHPMGRFGTTEEVADAVLWLCSDKSSFVTGHALSVDGGWAAR